MAADNMLDIIPDDLLGKMDAVEKKLGSIETAIDELNAKSKAFTIEVKGLETLNQLVNAQKAQLSLDSQLATAANEYKNASDTRNQIYKEASDLIARKNGHSKEEITISKGVADVYIKEAKARVENAKAMLDEQKYIAALTKEKERLEAQMQKQQKAAADAQNAYVQLKKTYTETANEAKRLSAEFGVGSKEAEKMTLQAQKLNKQLVDIEKSVGQYQRNVGNYASATMAVSQLIREAPAFANSLQTGLSALGNNFPILFDQFKILRAELGSTTKAIQIMGGSILSFTNLFSLAYLGILLFANTMKSATSIADDYNKALQDVNKTMGKTAIEEQNHASVLLDIAKNTHQAMDIRLRAVQDLQQKYPDYLGNLSKEAILMGNTADAVKKLNDALFDKAMMQAYESKISAAAKAYADLNDQLSELDRSTSKTLAESTTARGRDLVARNAAVQRKEITDQMDKYRADIERFRNMASSFGQGAAGLILPGLDKGKKPSSKDVTDELQAEKERHKLQLELNQQAFLNSRKTFDDELELNRKNEDEARTHGENMLDIIEKWHTKQRITDEKYLAYNRQIQADLIKELNDAKKNGDKIRAEILERHIKAGEAINVEVEKMMKLRAEIEKINREIDNIHVKAAIRREYATGFSPFLQALGFDGSFAQGMASRNTDIAGRRSNISALNGQKLALSPDTKDYASKLLEFDKQIASEKKSIAELEAQNEEAINQRIIKSKEDLAHKSIEAATFAYEAIKRIQEDSFAAEAKSINDRQRLMEQSYDDRVRAIQAETGYEEEKNQKIKDLNANRKYQEEKIEQDRRDLEKRKAQFEREAAIAEIIAKTAVGIAAALPYLADPFTAGYATASIAIISAMGAAQAALVASAPIPSYAEGTDNHPGGFALIGEGGEPEYVTTPSGKGYWQPAKATVVDLPKGSTVTPLSKMAEYASYSALALPFSASTATSFDIVAATHKQTKEILSKLDDVVDANLMNKTLIQINTNDPSLRTRITRR